MNGQAKSSPMRSITEEHQRVRAALKHCKGAGQAVSNADLAAALGLNARRVRRLIKELIECFGDPIGTSYGSNSGGHYWIVSQAELSATVDGLKRAAFSIFRRVARLDKRAASRLAKQLPLELEQ